MTENRIHTRISDAVRNVLDTLWDAAPERSYKAFRDALSDEEFCAGVLPGTPRTVISQANDEERICAYLRSRNCSPNGARFDITENRCEDTVPENFERILIPSVIDALDEPEDPYEYDPLGFEVFRNSKGDYITEVVIAAGGPSITAIYDSRNETLQVRGV